MQLPLFHTLFSITQTPMGINFACYVSVQVYASNEAKKNIIITKKVNKLSWSPH